MARGSAEGSRPDRKPAGLLSLLCTTCGGNLLPHDPPCARPLPGGQLLHAGAVTGGAEKEALQTPPRFTGSTENTHGTKRMATKLTRPMVSISFRYLHRRL